MPDKTYGQFCALARALDHVGDRWTLLVVRELLLGPARYGELVQRLPGVATNLLADRLRDLEADGIVARVGDGSKKTAPYELTERGRSLEPVVFALVRWGAEWMREGPRPGDRFEPRWLALALRVLLEGPVAPGPRGEVEVRVGGEVLTVVRSARRRLVRAGPARKPAATVTAEGPAILAVADGLRSLGRAPGVRVDGDEVLAAAALAPASG